MQVLHLDSRLAAHIRYNMLVTEALQQTRIKFHTIDLYASQPDTITIHYAWHTPNGSVQTYSLFWYELDAYERREYGLPPVANGNTL